MTPLERAEDAFGGWLSVPCLIETSKHVLSLSLRGIVHHASRLPVGESFDSPSIFVRQNSVSDHASDILRRPRHLKGDLTPLERADILRNGCERRSRNRRNLRWFQPDAESRTGSVAAPTPNRRTLCKVRPLGSENARGRHHSQLQQATQQR
jgi:hypothetical protein